MELLMRGKEDTKVKFQLSVSPEIDTKFRQYVANKYGGTRRGSLSTELEIALRNLVEKEGKEYGFKE